MIESSASAAGHPMSVLARTRAATAAILAAALAGGCGGGGADFSDPNAPKPFTTWDAFYAAEQTAAGSEAPRAMRSGLGYSVTASSIAPAGGPFFVNNGASAMVAFGQDRRFTRLSLFQTSFSLPSFSTSNLDNFFALAAIGQPGIDFTTMSPLVAGQSPFTTLATTGIAFAPNPFDQGWEFQSFGVWDRRDFLFGPQVTVATFGAPAAGPAVPTTGSATFVGKLGGLHVSPSGEGSIVLANTSVMVNFAAGSLTLSTTATVTTRDVATTAPAPDLDLSGALAYSASSNIFTGTLTNAGGTMTGTFTGRYYGPAARELGGVYVIRSSSTAETFVGAHGARR
jgi:hypothetical protein